MSKRGASGGGGGGGSSPKKRAKAAGATSAASAAPLFFLCPGAGGVLPADKPGEAARSIKTLLAEIGDVAGPMDKPPMGGGGCSAKAMAAFQGAVEGAVAANPGRDVWLASQSFGGRLAVHTTIGGIENRDATGKPKPWADARPWPTAVKGIVAFGYPLHHAKQNRAAPLLELPAGTRMMFVMGEKDDMALGKPVNKSLLTGARRSARSAPSPRAAPRRRAHLIAAACRSAQTRSRRWPQRTASRCTGCPGAVTIRSTCRRPSARSPTRRSWRRSAGSSPRLASSR